MQVEKGKWPEVKIFKPETFEDHRGEYVELYNERSYHEAGCKVHFVQDDFSASRKDVLRGLHGDKETWKLISCLRGEFYFVILDYREGSPTFGEWQSFVLTEKNHMQVLVPPGFANGHLALSDRIIFHYKQSAYYNPRGQFSVRWDDERFKIWWPIKNPILSRRDEAGGYVD